MNEKIYAQLKHRLELVEQTHSDLEFKHIEQTDETHAVKKTVTKQFTDVKEELQDFKNACNNLQKALFTLGNSLKDKLPQKHLEQFQEKVDTWQLTDFIHKTDLKKSFDFYKN